MSRRSTGLSPPTTPRSSGRRGDAKTRCSGRAQRRKTCRIASENATSLEEWQALRASFKERDRDAEPPVLAPADAFDATRPDEEFRGAVPPRPRSGPAWEPAAQAQACRERGGNRFSTLPLGAVRVRLNGDRAAAGRATDFGESHLDLLQGEPSARHWGRPRRRRPPSRRCWPRCALIRPPTSRAPTHPAAGRYRSAS